MHFVGIPIEAPLLPSQDRKETPQEQHISLRSFHSREDNDETMFSLALYRVEQRISYKNADSKDHDDGDSNMHFLPVCQAPHGAASESVLAREYAYCLL